jgi:hypothetical protein
VLKLVNGPGEPQLLRFGQIVIDGVHDHPDHALLLILQCLSHS